MVLQPKQFTLQSHIYINVTHVISFHRYGSIYQCDVYHSEEGLLYFKQDPHQIDIGGNLFKCTNNVFISIQLLCDGNYDCPDGPVDEIGCECLIKTNHSNKCKFLSTETFSKSCSHFYFTTKNNSCQMYNEINLYKINEDNRIESHNKDQLAFLVEMCQNLKEANENNIINAKLNENCFCNHGMNISLAMVNDLVPDCGFEAEDEYLIKNLVSGNISHCSNKSKVPCRQGHPRCYDISEVCQYKLDKNMHLIPCRTGEDLQHCKKFECNMMFRCPVYYCIP